MLKRRDFTRSNNLLTWLNEIRITSILTMNGKRDQDGVLASRRNVTSGVGPGPANRLNVELDPAALGTVFHVSFVDGPEVEPWGRAAPGSDRVGPGQDRVGPDQGRDLMDQVSVPLGRPGRSLGLVFCRRDHASLQCEQIFGE